MPRISKENIKITTPVLGCDVELLPYATAELSQMNEAVFLAYANFDLNGAVNGESMSEDDIKETMRFDKLPATAISEIKNNAIKFLVVTVDGDDFGGDDDAKLKSLLKLPREDFDFIQEKIEEITGEVMNPKGEQKSAQPTPKQ